MDSSNPGWLLPVFCEKTNTDRNTRVWLQRSGSNRITLQGPKAVGKARTRIEIRSPVAGELCPKSRGKSRSCISERGLCKYYLRVTTSNGMHPPVIPMGICRPDRKCPRTRRRQCPDFAVDSSAHNIHCAKKNPPPPPAAEMERPKEDQKVCQRPWGGDRSR